MQLAQLQQALLEALNGDANGLAPMLVRRSGLPNDRQLDVYRNNRHQARLAALTQIYPICLKILGQRCFTHLAGRFIRQQRCIEWDLNRYGKHFSEFLQSRAELHDYAYIPDLARLEYRLSLAYYARDETHFDVDQLRKLTARQQESIIFELSNSVHLLSSEWPLFELQRAYASNSLSNSIAATGWENLVVFRQQYKPRVAKVNAPCFELLSAIAAGKTLLQICRMPAGERYLVELHSCCMNGWVQGYSHAR